MAKIDYVPIIFRVDKNNNVFAIFPTIPGTSDASTSTIYDQSGGHTSGDVFMCIRTSRPASLEQYQQMYEHLLSIGYKIRIVKRCSNKMHLSRLRLVEEYLKEKG